MGQIAWELLITRRWLKGCKYKVETDDEYLVYFFIRYKRYKVTFIFDPEKNQNVTLIIEHIETGRVGPSFSTMQCERVPEDFVMNTVKNILEYLEEF